MKNILNGLNLPPTDDGYKELSLLICKSFGIEINPEELRSLADSKITSPFIRILREWPWKLEKNEVLDDFYEKIRNAANESGYPVQPDKFRFSFRCPRKVFLSYARPEANLAEHIAQLLSLENVQVFFDRWQLNNVDSISEKIDKEMKASDFLVILFSPAASESRWVRSELALGQMRYLKERDITIIPVIVEDCEIPNSLKEQPRIDLRSDTERELKKLIRLITYAPRINFSLLNERKFNHLVVEILKKKGFQAIEIEPSMDDRRFDLQAEYFSSDSFGVIKKERWLIDIRLYRKQRPDLRSVRQLALYLAAMPEQWNVLLVTNSQLTSAARNWLTEEINKRNISLRVIEGPELKHILVENIELIDRYFSI